MLPYLIDLFERIYSFYFDGETALAADLCFEGDNYKEVVNFF